ncbi:MAG: hypothetical protein U0230_17690 [Polyangiales bacterium]
MAGTVGGVVVWLVLSSCGGAASSAGRTEATASLEDFAGTWTIEGSPAADGCQGQVYLAARHVTIDPVTRTLFADVVDRTYAAHVEGDALVAEGDFEARGSCPGKRLEERWTFRRTSASTLEGRLVSGWVLPPVCSQRCLVTFDLAVRR